MFNVSFRPMIEENSVSFILYRKQGAENIYVNGDLVKPTIEPEIKTGVILPFTDDDLRYAEGGTYSVKDKKLYVLEAIAFGTEIEYKGTTYTVQQFKDFTDYSDVFIYVARYAGKGG